MNEKLENLERIEKQVKKLQKKGMKILLELETENSYNGNGEEFARKDFENSIEWMFRCLQIKRKWIMKFDNDEGD